MKKAKKLLSVILSALMILSVLSSVTMAEEATQSEVSSELVLRDFGNPSGIPDVINGHDTLEASAVAYGSKTSSLKFTMSKNAVHAIDIPVNSDMDLSNYNVSGSKLNIRFYSENAGSKFNLVYYKTGAFSGNYYPNPSNITPVIEGGWQVFTVDFPAVYAKTGNTITLQINYSGWNNANGFNEGDTVYLDSVWIAKDGNSAYKNMSADDYLLYDSEVNNVIESSTKKFTSNTVKTSDLREGGNLKFNYLVHEATTEAQAQFFGNTSTYPVTSEYNYLNAWIYSPEPQDGGMQFYVWDKDGIYSGIYPITQLDWKGWKLVSLDLQKNYKAAGGATYDTIKDGITYISANLNGSGWSDMSSKGASFGIESIWLSKGTTSPQAAFEASQTITNPKVSLYSTELDITPSGNSSIYNSRLNNKVSRLSFAAVANNAGAYVSADGTKQGLYSGFYSQIDLWGSRNVAQAKGFTKGSKNYLNLWMYSPSPVYDFQGNYSELVVVAKRYKNTQTTSTLQTVGIPVNWSGWKLVSIPLGTNGFDFWSNQTITHIYIGANIGWFPKFTAGTTTFADGNYHVATAESNENKSVDHRVTTSGSYNIFTKGNGNKDQYKYIDIERAWISVDAPSSAIELNSAAGDVELLCTKENSSFTYNPTASANIQGADINVISITDGVVSNENVSVESVINANVAELKANTTYKICYKNIYDKNSNVINGYNEFEFSTEKYHVSDIVLSNNNTTATVSLHGVLPESYASPKLIAAFYADEECTKLDNVIISEDIADGKVSVTASESLDASDVKLFLLDGMTNIMPVEYNVKK